MPGWRAVYGETAAEPRAEVEGRDEDELDQQLPRLREHETVQTRAIESLRKETKPPRRYSDASLLGAMETAGKLVEDDELREAMKDSGIGTPATRAAIIERLIAGRLCRARRALADRHREGLQRDPAARPARPHIPWADRRVGAPAGHDRARGSLARGLHEGHRGLRDRDRARTRRQAQGRPHTAGPSAPAPCAVARLRRTARATRAGRARTPAAAS